MRDLFQSSLIVVFSLACIIAASADHSPSSEIAPKPVGSNACRPASESADSDRTAKPIPRCTIDLSRELKNLKVPGLSAALVKDGKVVCTAVAGVADSKQGKPVTPDTGFLWASVSKTVTVTALMQLFEQGKFRLDDDINDYLDFKVRNPGFPDKKITFRQLLTHTSSILDDDLWLGNDHLLPGDYRVSLKDFVRGYLTPGGKYYNLSTNFSKNAPGTKKAYSSLGTALVGHLVEALSGMDFSRYVKERIFTPLKMPQASFRLSDLDPNTVALPNGTTPHYGEPDYPASMLRATPTQLANLLIMTMQGGQFHCRQILRPSTVKEILKGQVPSLDDDGETQGLVWYSQNTFGRTTWGHDGDDKGTSSEMHFDPATGTGVLLVGNGEWKKSDSNSLVTTLFKEADTH